MPVPEKSLYNEPGRSPGEIAQLGPGDYAVAMVAECPEAGGKPTHLEFGKAAVRGTAHYQAKQPDAAAGHFLGVLRMGVDASDLKNRRFADGDAVAIQKLGTIAVNTTEPVKPGDAVRFRHTNGAATAGHQDVRFRTTKQGSDATGLANDTTAYTETITVDGTAKAISVAGNAAQTFTALLRQINTDLGSAGTPTIAGGNLRITSGATGKTSSVAIQPGGTLFAALTDFDRLNAPVAGHTPVDQAGLFCKNADSGKTTRITAGAEWASESNSEGVADLLLWGAFTTTDD